MSINLMIFNRYDSLTAILSNEGDRSCLYWDAPLELGTDFTKTFSFNTLANHEFSSQINTMNQVAFFDRHNKFRLFKIESVEALSDIDGDYYHVVCESAVNELLKFIVAERRPSDYTAHMMIDLVLEGTRYEVGDVESFGNKSSSFFRNNVLESIHKIANLFSGELEDRYVIENGKITGRYIDMVHAIGNDTGKTLELSHDVLKFSQTDETATLFTGLYGVGASIQSEREDEETGDTIVSNSRKVTFEDIEWQVANGDPLDKPFGQEFLVHPEATNEYGLVKGVERIPLFGIMEFDTEDPEELLQLTYNALIQSIVPRYSFEIDVVTLGGFIGYEAHAISLGDTLRCINREFATPIFTQSRVGSIKYDIADDNSTIEVKLGHITKLYNDDRLDNIEDQLNQDFEITIPVPTLPPITDGDIADVVPSPIANIRTSVALNTIFIEWENQGGITLREFELYASQVSGFIPSSTNRIYVGRGNFFAHAVDFNQQWYYIARGINVHGTAGSYSSQISEQTGDFLDIDLDEVYTYLDGRFEASEERITSNLVEIYFDPLSQQLSLVESTFNQFADEIQLNVEGWAEDKILDELTNSESDLSVALGGIILSATEQKFNNIDGKFDELIGTIEVLPGEIILKVTEELVDPLNDALAELESEIQLLPSQITLSVKEMYIDPLTERVVQNESDITVMADLIALTVADLTELGFRMTQAEIAITAENIISTVTESQDLASMFESKADQESLSELATNETVNNMRNDFGNALESSEEGLRDLINEVGSNLTQTKDSLTAQFENAGGVNYLRNSIGMNGYEYWTLLGYNAGEAFSPETTGLQDIGSNHGFKFYPHYADISFRQVLNVTVGQDYTLSWRIRKTEGSGAFEFRFYNVNGGVVKTVKSYEAEYVTDGFEQDSVTFTVDTEIYQVALYLFMGDGIVEVTSLMLNIGDNSFSWTPHPTEVYSTSVRMDGNGIRVQNNNYEGSTYMTPERFYGTYIQNGIEQEVFQVARDGFEMFRAVIEDSIELDTGKVLSITSNTNRGLAFVANASVGTGLRRSFVGHSYPDPIEEADYTEVE